MVLTWDDFEKVDMRVGTIIRAEVNEKARNPAYKVWVDFGDELGVKQSSAQITKLYSLDDLIGKRVICVVNFEPKRIAGFKSEILITGFQRIGSGEIVLSTVNEDIENGSRLC